MKQPIVLILCCLLAAATVSVAQTEGRLDFLKARDSGRAYVLDSSLSYVDLLGFTLTPPYERGLDELKVLVGVDGSLVVEKSVDVSDGGRLMALALSPDGDTAVVTRFFSDNPAGPHEVVIVQGLSGDEPEVAHVLPHEAVEPHCVAVSPDGTYAVVGNTTFGPPTLTVIRGLPDSPEVAGTIQLGLNPGFAADVESLDFSKDGERLLVQTDLWDSAVPPVRFLPRVMVQVVKEPWPGGQQQVSAPLLLPSAPFLPAQPPFAGMNTGVALGDSVILGDGDSAIVPVSGALDLGQPDARILLLRGVRSGALTVARTLTPVQGVGVAPFQVALAPDCDRAFVTISGPNGFNIVSGLADPSFATVGVTSMLSPYPVPSEPTITPDGGSLVVHHPRVPINYAPPPAVTNYSPDTQLALGPPLFGPVRSLAFFKDAVLAAHEPSLTDYVDRFTGDLCAFVGKSLRVKIRLATKLADRGKDRAARGTLALFRLEVRLLRRFNRLSGVEAKVLDDIAKLAQNRLD